VGQLLGNYRLVRLLGRGGFAQVYLGEHVRLGTQAAIKVLSTQLAAGDVQLFLTEARTIARLEHPHIVRILDFDIEQDTPFFVMSYAPNGTLRQRYPRGECLPPESIRVYLKQAADALQYAHDARMIHRDIKPENILLGRQGEILLSDFGIAVIAHTSRSERPQDIVGTLPYMAPEQIQGRPRPASDQYALGITVYEWFCGYPPFRGTAAEVAMQHLHADLPPLHEQLPDIPPAVEAVIHKALEKDPRQRFASVREFAAAFETAYQAVWPEKTVAPPPLVIQPVSQDLLQTSFHALPTEGEHRAPSPVARGRTGCSRRALLGGLVGVAGLAGAGGVVAWVALARSPLAHQLSLGDTLLVYTGHQAVVTTVAWSPRGDRLASGSQDQTVQVWDASSGAHPLIYRGLPTNINTLAWSPLPADPRIASAGGNDFFQGNDQVQIWNAVTGANILAYRNYTQPVRSVAWSPDGTRIASGGEDKVVQIWEASSGKFIRLYNGHKGAVNAIAWSPDGTRIASASDDRTVQIWDVQSASQRFSLPHANTVNAVAWSPDGKQLASASGNAFFGGEHNAQTWDATNGTPIRTYQGHAGPVNSVAWSPDGKRIASASSDKTVRIWRASDGSLLFVYHGHTLGVADVAWSPDGRYIASAGADGTVRVWRAS
jgi:Tol biopolymer transport system component